MTDLEIRPIRNLLGRRRFVDVPFRIHGGDPAWIPPLRMTVYDRLSSRHPAMAHQETALWVALRHGRPVGRIGACVDSAFNDYQGVSWAWVGFFDTFDDQDAATALFETAFEWARENGAATCVGPASFTTNDELGLLVEGYDIPPTIMTTENPPYYERLWTEAGWEPAMDLLAWHFDKATTALSQRQRDRLERIRAAAKVRARDVNMKDWDADVGRFFEVYNAAWQDNWGFAPMLEPEVRHLAKQLKQIINPRWAFGLESEDGEVLAVCLALPDVNPLMAKVRSGRLAPFGWIPLLAGRRKVSHARVWALGIRPDRQHLALGPLLYHEIVERLASDPYIRSAEASWTLASNTRINRQLESMGARQSKRWRLYQHEV
jgi:GNAT superfamily N-acetyltransferase